MVNVKIDNKLITDVEKIQWSSQLIFEWPTQRVYNQIGGIYFLRPFTYTPAPQSRNRKDKVYGANRKSKTADDICSVKSYGSRRTWRAYVQIVEP